MCQETSRKQFSPLSIQVEEDRTTVNDPNLFLLGFLHAAAAFDCFHSVELTLDHLREGWKFYQAVVVANNINDNELQQLFKEITKDWKISKGKFKKLDSVETVEGAEVESLSMQTVKQLQRVGSMQERPAEESEEEDRIEFQSITASWWVPLTTSEQHTV